MKTTNEYKIITKTKHSR